MPVTIKDVARKAGVSPSTVSRVISNHPRISPATCEVVRQAMKELKYHPNAIARSLVTQTAKSVGVIMSRSTDQALSNPFFPEVIRGISSVAQEHQFSLLLSTSRTPQEEKAECLSMLRHRRVDGVILLASRLSDALVTQLKAEGHPFVVVGRVPGDSDVLCVNNDNVLAASQAVGHLVELGHAHIGFIGGMPDLVVSRDRLEGYRRALEQGGLPYREELAAESDFTLESGIIAARCLLDCVPRPTAIFAVDDLLALGALRAIRERGLRVPQDVALVGFNDDPIDLYLEPQLSTVRIPIYRMGATAAEMVIRRITGEPIRPRQVLLPGQLVIRESCGGSPARGGASGAEARLGSK